MKKWSIKKQLKLFIGVLLLLLVSMVTIVHFGLKRIDDLNQIEQRAHELKALHVSILSYQNAYLLYDSETELFYNQNISEHRQLLYAAIDQSISVVKELKLRSKMDLKNSIVNYVGQLYRQYETTFEKLDISLHERGFGNYGLIGQLNSSKNEIIKLATTESRSQIIELINSENKFRLQADSSSFRKITTILSFLEENNIENENQLQAITTYKIAFLKLATLQKNVFDTKNGLLSELQFVGKEMKLPVELIANKLFHDVENQIIEIKLWLYSVLLLLSTLLFFLIIFIYKNIMKSSSEMLQLMQKVSEGDLSLQLKTENLTEFGKIREMLDQIVTKFRDVISEIQDNTDDLLHISDKFEQLATKIENGSQKQQTSVEKMTHEIHNMSDSVRQNYAHTLESQFKTEEANQLLKTSERTINETLLRIHTMNSKINVVDEIARLTNMLSLNASVEAARVGVHGKGFGVVANEIRKLAEKSKEASTDIAVFSKTSEEISIRAKEMLLDVILQNQESVELTKRVAETSEIQKSNTDLIVSEMGQFREIIEQNVLGAHELASSALLISEQSKSLNLHVSYFRI